MRRKAQGPQVRIKTLSLPVSLPARFRNGRIELRAGAACLGNLQMQQQEENTPSTYLNGDIG